VIGIVRVDFEVALSVSFRVCPATGCFWRGREVDVLAARRSENVPGWVAQARLEQARQTLDGDGAVGIDGDANGVAVSVASDKVSS
jgi:hypothetical protein